MCALEDETDGVGVRHPTNTVVILPFPASEQLTSHHMPSVACAPDQLASVRADGQEAACARTRLHVVLVHLQESDAVVSADLHFCIAALKAML